MSNKDFPADICMCTCIQTRLTDDAVTEHNKINSYIKKIKEVKAKFTLETEKMFSYHHSNFLCPYQ